MSSHVPERCLQRRPVPSGGSIWRVAYAIAWRSLHTYVRRPDLFVPSLIFPLVFLASFAGGLSALGSVPGFHFPAGYTAFQFVFVLCQSAMFAGPVHGLHAGVRLRKRLRAAADAGGRGPARDRARLRAGGALARGDHADAWSRRWRWRRGCASPATAWTSFGLYGLAALLVLVGYGWAAGVAFRFRSIQAGPLMQTPVFLILFLAPVYVPLAPAQGLDPRGRERQPGDRLPRRRTRPDLGRARPHGACLRLRAGADRGVSAYGC